MNRLVFALLFALAACTDVSVPTGPEVSLLRNPTAPMGSQADVTAEDMAGDWAVRQGLADRWPGNVGGVIFAADDGTLFIEIEGGFCEENGPCVTTVDRTDYFPGEPGRFAAWDAAKALDIGLPPEIWVLWMDFDRRTMAIGDPDGSFVAILDRNFEGGADRIAAARDILDWYGYDLSQLVEVQ